MPPPMPSKIDQNLAFVDNETRPTNEHKSWYHSQAVYEK